MKHLSVRVAWHQNRWNGTNCSNPQENSYCLTLPRIYEEKQDDEEGCMKWWMEGAVLPPCKAESGAFMCDHEYKRVFSHVYRNRKDADHSHLEPTSIPVPPYSTFVVPFRWMLLKNQPDLDKTYPDLPRYSKAPFPSSWVYNQERQLALNELFYNQLEKGYSLVFFYTKNGNPVDENVSRLLIGIGLITYISPVLEYKKSRKGTNYPIWDRKITHTIRPDGEEGFLVPYHEYLESKDPDIERKLDEIKLILQEPGEDEGIIEQFSYGSEHVSEIKALKALEKFKKVIEVIKEHGIVKGPWDKRLVWISEQIRKVKKGIGPFPGFDNALSAFGFKQAHLLTIDMYKEGLCKDKDNPWDIWEDIIYSRKGLKNSRLTASAREYKEYWYSLPSESKSLLMLLSRFEINAGPIKKWFDNELRQKFARGISDQMILNNPYLIAEIDEGDQKNKAISVETIDLGLFEDKAIQGEFTPDPPSAINSEIDIRRIRALIVQILKRAALEGDTLLSCNEIRERLNQLKLSKPTEIPEHYIHAHINFIKERCEHIASESLNALQLKLYSEIDDYLRRILLARASKLLDQIDEDWTKLIKDTVQSTGRKVDISNPRHNEALKDQARALEVLTSHKLSILHGPAGTGKTSVLGALFRSKILKGGGILLLAPTGKARERLKGMAKSDSAFTIAQFLTRQKRFDWEHMKPFFHGKETYKGEKTVVIDECSMLTCEDFYAVLRALDLSHVQRIILVGDPFQLPPIGPGKPFADLCNYLETVARKDPKQTVASEALARLEVVVRTATVGSSDTLTLASWFAGLKPPKNADEIFSKIENNIALSDLKVEYWENSEKLEDMLKAIIEDEFKISEEELVAGFNKVLGYEGDSFPITEPQRLENFQLLSPVKNPLWGTYSINRFIQNRYRESPKYWTLELGDQKIKRHDKVIQLVNEKKEGYHHSSQDSDEYQLSNGQIGIVTNSNKSFANICFTGIPEVTFGYKRNEFSEDERNIELAYAITIHKSQGSDFNTVIVILPKTGRILSRELIYTAITRAKGKLILLVEGENFSWLYKYTKPETSETNRRNTNLFISSVRSSITEIPYAENLIHKTLKDGLFVRSKSEVIIANMLVERKIDFEYEAHFIGEKTGGIRLPDFTFIDSAGDKIILEHLGMLHKPSYRDDWEKKKQFYSENGMKQGENLFITKDDEHGAIDSDEIRKVLDAISKIL
jgi:ATP-dependent exoDNAse (exonuclease V) alpha subunit